MRQPTRASICLGALPLCLAVGTVGDPNTASHARATLHTDRITYEALPTLDEPPYFYTFTLVARLDNGMARPLQIKRRCPQETAPQDTVPEYDVQAVEEDLNSGYSPVQICAEIRPTPVIVVPPGESRFDTLHITGPHMWNGYTKEPGGVLAGRFRLAYELHPCARPLDCDEVISNEFKVRLGR
jgi:hypothetical protein